MKKTDYIEHARARLLEGMGLPPAQSFVVDAFQREAIEAVVDGRDTLVVAPTGAGKTYIALEAISAMLQLKCRSVYTTPLKALSNTKYTDLKKRFEPEHSVGLLTGDRKIDTDADVVVATTEIYRNELYREYGRYSLVVLDEIHFIADLQRGPVWEESIILTPADSTLLMLSASISNAEEIAAWLESVRGKPCTVVTERRRPVELRLGFLHPNIGVLPLADESGRVFREVERFYDAFGLDASGMRLRDKRGDRSGDGEHGSSRRSVRGAGRFRGRRRRRRS